MKQTLASRLIVHVEGETEETFVKEVLSSHLEMRFGWSTVSARLMGNARRRDHRGGVKPWSTVQAEIAKNLRQDHGLVVTMMVDYYAMPRTGPRAWPGREDASALSYPENAKIIERRLSGSIQKEMRPKFNQTRFVPYVMMHEFEALLFSDCIAFGRGIGHPDLSENLQQIRESFTNPEEIDDSPEGAPSKRVERLVPGYEKPLLGNLAALEIGLEAMRRECPLFDNWLRRLESRTAQP
ncbi:MAG: DUF4276 family protein [Bryobacterales bacterium]|nr:DUF4276 family protein [Bryobacterales bacterium]